MRETITSFFQSDDTGSFLGRSVLIFSQWKLFLTGVTNTVMLVGISLVIGRLIAIPMAVIRVQRVPVLSSLVALYVYVIRGTPLLVQLYFVYYGLSQFEAVQKSFAWDYLREPWWCALLTFTVGTSAYTAEILRGGILAVPRGEIEACISVGMSKLSAYRRVILPSAFRRVLPAYGNEVIFATHASVVASTVTIIDIVGAARQFNNTYYLAYEGFLAAAVLYLILVFLITRVFAHLERRLYRHLKARM
ncbi:ABC transporter permease [Paracoccus sp. 11-3]|uniref:ABC transporter permease n=1 Tax=Paracoccus amoyensis TaxID=2760093 RepID=A0A926JE68_9RHOB|nr:ABC transporter permease [Paracoccus amoyensis]MBC9248559.1 ABC transporter permease [Paracoccus amoyensis]